MGSLKSAKYQKLSARVRLELCLDNYSFKTIFHIPAAYLSVAYPYTAYSYLNIIPWL